MRRGAHRRRSGKGWIGLLIAALVGGVVGGGFGAIVATCAAVASRDRGLAVLWWSAAALLAVAAGMTLFDGQPAQVATDYAARRPVANAAALASLLIVGVATVVAAGRERSRRPGPGR